MVVTFLSGYLLALFLSNGFTLLLLFVLSFHFRNLLAVLFSSVAGHFFVLCVAFLLVFSVAFLSRNIFAVLFRNIITHLIRDLLTDLLRFAVALLLGHNRSHWLLDIMTFLNWNRTAERFVGDGTNFISNIISIRNRLGVAILLGNLLAVLIWHLLTLLSGLFPALLPGFIPTLLVSIHIGTFLLSNSLTLLLIHSLARLLISGVTDLLILCVALLLFSVLLHWFLDSVALLLRDIMALLLCL